MQQSRGNICPYRMFSVREMGLSNPEPYVEHAIHEFLKLGEAVAARWIQMPKGILLFQMAPDDPASGAIYLFDRLRQEFYMVGFDGPDDSLTLDEFFQLVAEYNLLQYAEQPGLLLTHFHIPGSA
jgi:hypothetical protein